MITVSIIGSGNVAHHLIAAFQKTTEIQLQQVLVRDAKKSDLSGSFELISNFDTLRNVDLFIIAVSDHAVATVAAQIPFDNALIAHTAGSISLADLSGISRAAVLYPLQTFSKNKAVNFRTVPICLESRNESDMVLLEKVARSISDSIYKIDSVQRKQLHLAAVFVNNFVNHLYVIGSEICDQHQIPFQILKPLILETAEKIQTLSPTDAQTGPAKRKDQQTIEAHLKLLSSDNQKNIYTLLSQSIQNHEHEL